MNFNKSGMTRLHAVVFTHPTPVGKNGRETTVTSWQVTPQHDADPGRQAWMNDRLVYVFERHVLVTVVPVSACAHFRIWAEKGEETTLAKDDEKPKGLADRLGSKS